MRKRLPRALTLAALPSLLVLPACNDPAGVSGGVEMPFDPSGRWEGVAEGTLLGAQFIGPMIVRLSLLGDPFHPPDAPFVVVELTGTWEWGGVSGLLDGFWDTPWSGQSNDGCAASGHYAQCALRLILEGPFPDFCANWSDVAGADGAGIGLLGWFEGSGRITAPHLRGEYFQGQYSDSGPDRPCTGPILVALDTNVLLDRI
jgi:hypothetical protein